MAPGAGLLEGLPAIAAVVYVVCVALRLALYNVTPEASNVGTFRGIPSTLGGALVASGFLTWLSLSGQPAVLANTLPAALLLLGALMVSPFHLPKLKARRSRLFNVFQAAVVAFSYVVAFARLLPEVLFAIGSVYMVCGLVVAALPGRPEPDEAEEPV